MVKHTLKQVVIKLPNCLIVFDHFVEMAQNEIAFLIILYKKNW